MTTWPFWWSWELEFGDHAQFSMSKRRINETDVREMMEEAMDLAPSKEPGRWIAHTRFERLPWHVVVEPVHSEQRLVVITVYPVQPLQ